MAFFDKTPAGQIVNRISNDVYGIDDRIPFFINLVFVTAA